MAFAQSDADLFQWDKSVISRHIKNVFEEGELSAEATVAKSATVQTEGGKQVAREIEFYNLDVIISVGYRVKSQQGVQFRIWATQRLREYIVKGFTMDDERLKNPPGEGHIDYFDELLERIRDIRSSERRVYLRVREILALAADYDATERETQVFFQTLTAEHGSDGMAQRRRNPPVRRSTPLPSSLWRRSAACSG